MKILILSSEFPPGPGGIGTHAYQLAKNFTMASQKVLILTPQDYATDEEIHNFNHTQPFTVKRFKPKRSPFSKALHRIRDFNSCLREFKPDVVLASGSRSIWIAGLLMAFYRSIPWFIVAHGTEFGQFDGIKAWVTRKCANRASAIICVSDYTRKIVRLSGVEKAPLEVIHNGADDSLFFELDAGEVSRLRKTLGVDGKFVLLTVGHVSARKGQEVVIRALPIILEKAPQVVYWMAGLPTEREYLQALAKELGVENAIRFLGRVSNEELRGLYNACDLFVMTSRQLADGDYEGYGIAVIEAALCGKAAVVSDNSGLAEAVDDGQTGLLVKQNDSEAVAEAICRLIEDPQELNTLSKNALSKASKQTWSKISAVYLDIFAEIIKRVES